MNRILNYIYLWGLKNMELLKRYVDSNKKNLLIYIGVCLFFYVVNYAFYRENVDAPVDLIFTVIYIFVAPGLMIFFTLFFSNMLLNNNKGFKIFIHLFFLF